MTSGDELLDDLAAAYGNAPWIDYEQMAADFCDARRGLEAAMIEFGPIMYTTDVEPDGGGTYEYRIQGEWITETSDGTQVRQVTDAVTIIAANTDAIRREVAALKDAGATRVHVQHRPMVDWEDFDWEQP